MEIAPGSQYIPLMTERIVKRFHPRQVILFGSHATGSSGSDSDVDLLVVMHEAGDKRQTAIAIRRLLADLPVCKDIVVTSPEEIVIRGDLVGDILRPALRGGKILYDDRQPGR